MVVRFAAVGAAALVAAASAGSADEEYSSHGYVTAAIVSTWYGLTPGDRYMLYTRLPDGYTLGDTAKTVNAQGRIQFIDELDYFGGRGNQAEACLYPEGSRVTDPPAVDAEGRELCGETSW